MDIVEGGFFIADNTIRYFYADGRGDGLGGLTIPDKKSSDSIILAYSRSF